MQPFRRRILTRGYCSEAQQYFARLTGLSSRDKKLLDKWIRALRDSGLWANLDAIYPFGASSSVGNARVNGKSSSFSCIDGAASLNFTAYQGVTGVTAELRQWDTQFNPTSGSPKFVQDSASVFAWGTKTGTDIGATVGITGTARTYIYPKYTDNTRYVRINCGTDSTSSPSSGAGLVTVVRTGASAGRWDLNGTQESTFSTSSSAPASGTLRIGLAGGDFYGGKIVLAGIGASMTATQSAILYQASLELFNSMGTTL
jgi:hypothetical protein